MPLVRSTVTGGPSPLPPAPCPLCCCFLGCCGVQRSSKMFLRDSWVVCFLWWRLAAFCGGPCSRCCLGGVCSSPFGFPFEVRFLVVRRGYRTIVFGLSRFFLLGSPVFAHLPHCTFGPNTKKLLFATSEIGKRKNQGVERAFVHLLFMFWVELFSFQFAFPEETNTLAPMHVSNTVASTVRE